jgi:hypothetical protein
VETGAVQDVGAFNAAAVARRRTAGGQVFAQFDQTH